ncbi:hypothetical protein [Hydrocarboniclastica marina]|uniref:Uncharacterized protein n=1 Tax=Hydrocarboniclastica marina TaxID=2259620 RepID=A0A4P7XF34_9ALTE|nr:hypothetical protein [Hydrocarboniclastica marina]QCF25014.1 hypothetical protein soil367_03140 [Hydrocarboniclastica marina]
MLALQLDVAWTENPAVMADIALIDEIHANTRRTRITYRGAVDGKPAAIKCYRKPLFGLVHWVMAQRRGLRIRRTGAPVPEVIYSGWLRSEKCFCFATVFMTEFQPLRQVLLDEPSHARRMQIVQFFGRLIADLHHRGIEQPDGNLTNFLFDGVDGFIVVDEDDIRVFEGGLPGKPALNNLANIAARLPDEEYMLNLLDAYKSASHKRNTWSNEEFVAAASAWRSSLDAKRAHRNVTRPRPFD